RQSCAANWRSNNPRAGWPGKQAQGCLVALAPLVALAAAFLGSRLLPSRAHDAQPARGALQDPHSPTQQSCSPGRVAGAIGVLNPARASVGSADGLVRRGRGRLLDFGQTLEGDKRLRGPCNARPRAEFFCVRRCSLASWPPPWLPAHIVALRGVQAP